MTFLLANWKYVFMAVLLALLGVQELRVNNAQTNLAEYKQEVQAQSLAAEQAARAEEARKQEAYDEQAKNARAELADREATIAQLADDGDRVRGELASFAKRACAQPKSPLGGKSESGQDPIALLSVLLSRADREAEELAGFADRLRIAGIACERASDQAR